MKYLFPFLAGAAVLLPASAPAQLAPADSALVACAAAARADQEEVAKPAANQAEAAYRRALRSAPADPAPRVGLARVISECRIPFANMMSAGRLIGESGRLLEEALELDPAHWEARYVLALNHFHSPAFLGKTGEAIEHLQILLRQQGDRADLSHFAGTHLYLGDLYQRTGRGSDAVAVWTRGVHLFPEHEGLRERLQSAGMASPPADRSIPDASADTVGPVYAIDGIGVRVRRRAPAAAVSATSLDRLEILTAPGGMADVMHGLRMQGALTQASDGSDLFVRGGEPAEAPVFVDGGRFLYPNTFESLNGGLFGVLDLNVIRDVVFSSGGFSARYGNALSGVLDVQTQGRPAQARGRVGLDLGGLSGSLWAPVAPRAGVWATGRVTDASVLAWQRGELNEFVESPRAAQTTMGLTFEPRDRTELKAVVVVQGDGVARTIDRYGHQGTFRSAGATRQGVLSGRTSTAGGARIQGAVSASERRSGFAFGVLDRDRTDRSLAASLLGVRSISASGVLRSGFDVAWLGARERGWLPQTADLTPDAPAEWSDRRETTAHLGFFLESELAASERLSLVAGLRTDRLPGETIWTADPRASLAYRGDGWTARAGAGVFHQGRWRSGYEIPDFESPAGVPRRARHLVLGLDAGRDGAVRVEAYAKEYDRYVEGSRSGPAIREGRAIGMDSRARWGLGEDLSGWVTYSYLRSRLSLENGSVVPSRVDVTHGLTTVAKWSIGDVWSVGATGRLATGRPYTTRLDGTSAGASTMDSRRPHDSRLPDYQRLDVRVTRLGRIAGRTYFSYLELLNGLNHRNVMGYTFAPDAGAATPIESFFSRRVAMVGIDLQIQ